MRFLITVLIIIMSTKAAYSYSLPEGFVYLHNVDDTIHQKLEFSTAENCVGDKLDGYNGNQVICTEALALKLKIVQKALKSMNANYSLRIVDAYRPVCAVEHLKRWAADIDDQKTKQRCYPDIDKKDLLGKYVAGNRSSHSRGSTVDIDIIDITLGEALDFGPNYFGEYANINYAGLTEVQKLNRVMLRDLMVRHGFKPYDPEFWHFTLINEPFPDTYFNFAIWNELVG